jgi:glycosyltransferase involved in cell wall biosynthesis
LYVGNIEPRKNLLPLIEAFENPRIVALGIPLLIAGRPAWNSQEILGKIASAKNTFYLGPVSENLKRYLMQKTSLFTFPSLFEGFGLPVLEAMASGAKVLSSTGGSLAEISGPSLSFSDLTTDAFVEDIYDALQTDYTNEARIASKNWAANFTWQKSIEKHIEVYESLAKGER